MPRMQGVSCVVVLLLTLHVMTWPQTVTSTTSTSTSTSNTGRSYDRSFLRKVFKCPTCALSRCPVPAGFPGCQITLETGVCACCPVCARELGQSCGLTTGRCAKGLDCLPLPGDPDPLGAILNGNAVCV